MEAWRDVPGYEGKYQVSSIGRVKSVKNREVILRPWTSRSGYLTVSLWVKCKKKNFSVHRLVAFAFIYNPDPALFTDVNHIDENKENNTVDNLEWVTHLENIRHGTARERMSQSHAGRPNANKGKKNPKISALQKGKPHPHKGSPRKGIKRKKVQL